PIKTGKLLLDSTPSGAQIFLDDKAMLLDNGDPARTPSDLTSLQYGTSYKIKLVKEGHDEHEQVILMGDATNNTTIKPRLKAKPRKTLARVEGLSAREARVYFSGQDVGLGPGPFEKVFEAHESASVTAKLEGNQCTADPSRVRVIPDGVVDVTVRCQAGRAK